MNTMKTLPWSVAALVALCATPALGQDYVRELQDIQGARASSGESDLESRGYRYVSGTKSGDSIYSYWVKSGTNECISVRTADGRYAAIVHTPPADCHLEAGSSTGSHPHHSNFVGAFDTVCGVITGGETYAYRCHIRTEGCQGEGYCRSSLRMPDNEFVLDWRARNLVEVGGVGLATQTVHWWVDNGRLLFQLGGNTYFVYRDQARARQELQRL